MERGNITSLKISFTRGQANPARALDRDRHRGYSENTGMEIHQEAIENGSYPTKP